MDGEMDYRIKTLVTNSMMRSMNTKALWNDTCKEFQGLS